MVGESHDELRTYRDVLTMVRMPAYFRYSKSHIVAVYYGMVVCVDKTWTRLSLMYSLLPGGVVYLDPSKDSDIKVPIEP